MRTPYFARFLHDHGALRLDPPADKGADAAETADKDTGDTEAKAGAEKAKPDKKEEAAGKKAGTFTQADLDAAKAAARKEAADEAARQKAEEQGEYQKLYETSKPQAELAARLAARTHKQIDEAVADWPEELKGSDPGKDDVEARLSWYDRFQPVAGKLKELPKAPETDAGKGSRPKAREKASADKDKGGAARYRFQQPGDVAW